MKKAILIILIMFYYNIPAFSKGITDTLKCLKHLSEKEFISKLELYCNAITIDSSNIVYTENDYVEILKLINTINAYSKYQSYSKYIDIFKVIIPKINETLDFRYIPGDGEYCEQFNLFTGGYPRASSIFWITDWVYPPGFPDIVDNCECMFPPCD